MIRLTGINALLRISVLPAFMLFCFLQLKAQETTGEVSAVSRHSVNLELGGKSTIIGSLNYEFLLRKRIAIGLGIGFNSSSRGQIIRNVNGVKEIGDFFDLYSCHFLSGTYFLGRDKHKMLFTAGLSNFLRYSNVEYPSETLIERNQEFQWNAGVGYQLSGQHLYFRTTAYLLALPNISKYAPSYLPWLGLTVGYRF